MTPKILITEPFVDVTDKKSLDKLREIADVQFAENTSEEQLTKEVQDVDVIITRLSNISRKIIDNGKVLKIIARPGTGMDNINIEAATERGIIVINVPALNADAVAEHTFGLILALSKNLLTADRTVREDNWALRDMLWPYNVSLYDKTLGIIGTGAIGHRVGKIGQAFGMQLLGYDKFPNLKRAEEIGMKYVDLKTLMKESDVVTCHVTLTAETEKLINKEMIALMKKDAILINCARGGIVDENALMEALKEKRIRGAGLDVFEQEPPQTSKQLFRFENTVLTPHIAGLTREVRIKTMETFVQDIIKAINGETPTNVVNPEVLQKTRNR